MNIKLEPFFDEIDELIQESEQTLTDIERVIFTKRYNLSQKHFSIFSVHSITMIYSIWEGFIQKVFSKYLSAINNLNIPFTDYHDSIIIFYMETKFKQLREYPRKENKKIEFFSELRKDAKSNKVNLQTSINTESNVGFEVLNRIMNQFSLEKFPEHWERYSYPNKNLKEELNSLLKYRNSIAHGGDLSSSEKVTQEVFNRYKRLIIDLMYGIRQRLDEGIQKKHYLKQNKGAKQND